MFRSITKAKLNPRTFRKISSMVGSGYSFRFNALLSRPKSMTSQIVPFFLGTPKQGEAKTRSSISSADNSCRAPMVH